MVRNIVEKNITLKPAPIVNVGEKKLREKEQVFGRQKEKQVENI